MSNTTPLGFLKLTPVGFLEHTITMLKYVKENKDSLALIDDSIDSIEIAISMLEKGQTQIEFYKDDTSRKTETTS
jgi:hypothetical protein